MINLSMAEIKEDSHFTVTPLGVIFIRTDGALFTIKDSERWVEIGPIPGSDREAELDWIKPEPDDEEPPDDDSFSNFDVPRPF